MLLTLANLLSEVSDEIPGKADEQAQVVRAANKVIRRIYTEFVEPLRSTFTTLPSQETGTVTTTIDLDTVTFSDSVLATTDPLRIVQIDGEQAWFGLTRSSTNFLGILSSKWPTTGASGLEYTIAYPTISFPATVGEILSIGREGFEDLKFSSDTRLSTMLPQVTTGMPTHWAPYFHDEAATTPNDDLRRVFLTPVALTRMVYNYTYRPRFTFIDSAGLTTQTIPLTDLWYEAVIAGTLFWLWKMEGNVNKAMLQNGVYEAALARARGANLPNAVIRPRRTRTGILAYENRPIADA